MSQRGFLAERAAWNGFPKVIRNGDLGALQKEPEYLAAKKGDWRAALDLVDRLIAPDLVNQVRSVIGAQRPKIVPVLAAEAAGNNKIPLAFAEVLADHLGLQVETGILQREKVHRTDSGADHRLAFNPSFTGSVTVGQPYLVVDDTLTMGGTLASLRGYIENQGGHVLAASVMTAHPGALDLAVKPGMLTAIEQKHGAAMNDFWKETFGYGIDQLTQGEAGHLKAAASVDAMRTRIAEARDAGGKRLDAGRASAAPAGEQTGLVGSENLLEDAQELQRQQQGLSEAEQVSQLYRSTLQVYLETKHGQVERIEDRLESFIEQQQSRIQQSQASQPGFFTRPSLKAAWQNRQAAQQSRLLSLHSRLESVREIKEGMAAHGPRLEELATRKLRAAEPQLASDFDAAQEAQRKAQAMQRKEDQERKQKQEHKSGRGHSLGIKPGR